MRISRSTTPPHQIKADFLVIGVFEGSELAVPIDKINTLLSGHLKALVVAEEFKAKEGTLLSLHTHGKLPQQKVFFLALARS